MDADIARHPIPEPSDGELYSLKVPRFLEFEPVAWDHKKFQPPTTDHHSNVASEHFSAYDTAMTTIRWRRSPSKPDELQSNARILRWSDGSLTLQLASQPLEQYELDAKLDAPAKVNPKKPTPRSALLKAGQNVKESYTYLAAPYHTASVVRVTNKITTRLAVIPTSTSKDSAIEMLQSALAKAANRTLDSKEQAISFINVDEDPELVRQRREAEFKQKQKAQRAKEKNEMKEREKQTRRMGGGRSAGYGLSIGGLEDEEGGRRGGVRRPRAKTGLRRDWSDDEDYGIRGKTREDEYDEEDDFIAASDEEEVVEDDEDDDDGIVESPPRRRQETQSPKRGRAGDNEDVVVSRTKRRRVVEDDDEDE
jgi:RNA polymerase-associated protein LEO1